MAFELDKFGTKIITFPSIKMFTIVEQLDKPLSSECVGAISKSVKSRYIWGVPPGRAILHMELPPTGMTRRLEPWVGAVHFSERIREDDQDPV